MKKIKNKKKNKQKLAHITNQASKTIGSPSCSTIGLLHSIQSDYVISYRQVKPKLSPYTLYIFLLVCYEVTSPPTSVTPISKQFTQSVKALIQQTPSHPFLSVTAMRSMLQSPNGPENVLHEIFYNFRKGGYVFLVSVFSWFVSRMTQKLLNWFPLNLDGGWVTVQLGPL